MVSPNYLILLVHLSYAHGITKRNFKKCLPTGNHRDTDRFAHDEYRIGSSISKTGCAVLCSNKASCSSFKYNGRSFACAIGASGHERPEAMALSQWNMYAETPNEELCLEGEGYSDGFCFKLHKNPTNVLFAKGQCGKSHGYLGEIRNNKTQSFLATFLRGRGGKCIWLGGYYRKKKQDWMWQGSGESIHFTSWAPNEPQIPRSKLMETCLSVRASQDFQWKAIRCSTMCVFLCQSKVTRNH